MRMSDHELRFAYALFFLFGLILHQYNYWYLKVLFVAWLTYEELFAVLNKVSEESLIISNIIGIVTFYTVYTGHYWYLTLPFYVAWGLYLNYLGLRH